MVSLVRYLEVVFSVFFSSYQTKQSNHSSSFHSQWIPTSTLFAVVFPSSQVSSLIVQEKFLSRINQNDIQTEKKDFGIFSSFVYSFSSCVFSMFVSITSKEKRKSMAKKNKDTISSACQLLSWMFISFLRQQLGQQRF